MPQGSAHTVVARPVAEVFAAVADITRMGEWSPECIDARWLEPATGPELGARFEGDNVAALGPVTLKRWATTSEVTACEPDAVFEFVAEGFTTWRYEFEERGGATRLTESFSHPPYEGWEKFLYTTLARRERGMVKGMERTIGRIKAALEAG